MHLWAATPSRTKRLLPVQSARLYLVTTEWVRTPGSFDSELFIIAGTRKANSWAAGKRFGFSLCNRARASWEWSHALLEVYSGNLLNCNTFSLRIFLKSMIARSVIWVVSCLLFYNCVCWKNLTVGKGLSPCGRGEVFFPRPKTIAGMQSGEFGLRNNG